MAFESWQLTSEVEDLAHRKWHSVSAALECAECHWEDHLQQVPLTDHDVGVLVEVLTTFVHVILLQWAELLSLLGDLGTVVASLQLEKPNRGYVQCPW